jgi:hypothetical protein
MGKELSYRAEAAAEYDRAFSHVSAYFLPFLPGWDELLRRLEPNKFSARLSACGRVGLP